MSLRASRQQLASLQTWTNFYDNSRGASQWTKTFACHLLVWSPTYNGPCSSRCRRSWWAARGSGPHTATCTEGQSGASQLMGLTSHLPIVRSRWEQQVKCSNNFQNFNYTDRLINFESVSKLKRDERFIPLKWLHWVSSPVWAQFAVLKTPLTQY